MMGTLSVYLSLSSHMTDILMELSLLLGRGEGGGGRVVATVLYHVQYVPNVRAKGWDLSGTIYKMHKIAELK